MTIGASDILSVARSVTKEWTKQRKAEERRSKSRYSRVYVYSDRVHFTDVADRILPDAYAHASGNGRYPVSQRQLYYACREEFKRHTHRVLDAKYFTAALLRQYLNRHPSAAAAWKITADPRGTLTIPNGRDVFRIPCGTTAIEDHLRAASTEIDVMDIKSQLPIEWSSLKHGQRYQGVLYIEKEGFEPLLMDARIADRYDLAILSCKGQSVVAARKFVDEVCRKDGGVRLFVVHDFDKAGFEISQALTRVSQWAEENDRVAYRFRHEINVIDLGLRLTDVKQYELASETVKFTGKFCSDSICTDEEKLFLRSNRRVELNAFTSPQFIEWLETKLNEHIHGPLVPDDEVLEAAYQRALAISKMNSILNDAVGSAKAFANTTMIPKSLKSKVRHIMKKFGQSWDRAVYDIACKKIDSSRK